MGERKEEMYRIRVRGKLHERWCDWFANLEVSAAGNGESILTVALPDQAALRGILDRLWDLNYEVLSVSPAGSQAEAAETTREANDTP